MFGKTAFIPISIYRPLIASGLLLLGALTGCNDPKCDQHTQDPACHSGPVTPTPGGDPGKPGTTPGANFKPDLAIGIFNVDLQPVNGGVDLGVCFTSGVNQITVENQDKGNAGAYKLAFGVFDATVNKMLGCKVPMASGTAAGATSQYSPQGKCCTISGSDLQVGHRIALFTCADIDKEVDESSENNNCWQGTPMELFAPASAERLVPNLRAALPSVGLTATALPEAPDGKWQYPLDSQDQVSR